MHNNLPTASIIIVNFNGKKLLQPCLASLEKLNYPKAHLDVMVIDNASTDGSPEFIAKEFPWVRVIPMDKNYGQMPAINKSIQYAKGDAIVVLDNDTVVDKNWLQYLVKVAYSDEKIGICGNKVLYMDAPNIIQFAGGYLHTLGGAISTYYRSENNFRQSTSSTGYVIGCSLLIKKNVFNLLEGFDEDYYMYGEEGDLCWRAWLYGYYVMYCPDSIIYHVAGASRKDKLVKSKDYELKRGFLDARAISETMLFHGNKNAIFTFVKNLEANALPSAFVFSSVLIIAQISILLKDKKPKFIVLLVKSCWWPIVNFKLIWRKRLKIQSERKISDDFLYKKDVLLPIKRLIMFTLSSWNKAQSEINNSC